MSMDIPTWTILVRSLIDDEGKILRGTDLNEWLGLIQEDYTDGEKETVDNETGGGE